MAIPDASSCYQCGHPHLWSLGLEWTCPECGHANADTQAVRDQDLRNWCVNRLTLVDGPELVAVADLIDRAVGERGTSVTYRAK